MCTHRACTQRETWMHTCREMHMQKEMHTDTRETDTCTQTGRQGDVCTQGGMHINIQGDSHECMHVDTEMRVRAHTCTLVDTDACSHTRRHACAHPHRRHSDAYIYIHIHICTEEDAHVHTQSWRCTHIYHRLFPCPDFSVGISV